MEFVEPIKEDFCCKVCKEAWDPDHVVQCADCQTIFCKPCYDEAMMKDSRCHACAKHPATFVGVHRLVRSMAENLQVYCKYKCHGCNWTGTRAQLTTHSASCDKKPRQFTYVREDAIPSELICPICVLPFTDPVQLPCEHIFCRQCATESLKRNSFCPVDRSPATADGFTQPPKLINSLLDEIPVYCANKTARPNPCAWEGRRRDYIGHKEVCKGGQPSSGAPADLISFPPATSTPTDSGKMQIQPITEFPTIQSANITQEIYALAHITAPTMESVEQRKKPLSISAVIDVSGSMSGAKLSMAMDSLRFMIEELSDRDELGIITFHTHIAEPFVLSKMNDEGKTRALAAVDTLRAQNCTNLSGGLFAGMDQVCRKPFTAVSGNTAPVMKKKSSRHTSSSSSSAFGGASDLFKRMMGVTNARLTFPPTDPQISTYCFAMKRDGKQVFTTGIKIKNPVIDSFVRSVSVEVGGQSKPATENLHHEMTFEHTAQPKTCTVKFVFDPSCGLPDAVHKFAAPAAGATIDPVPNIQLVHSSVPPAAPAVAAVPAATAASTTEDSCRAVLLFTDGVANNGITQEPEFAAALKTKLGEMDDMVIHTFGFGADHNARLLQNLSQIGAGSYYFIQDVATMKESFADCLGGLLSTVAQNITLEVTPQPGFAIDRLMTTLKNEIKDGRAVVTMRDVYSAEQRDILVKLKQQDLSATSGTVADIVKFTIHYDSLLSGKTENATATCKVGLAKEKSTDAPNKTLDEQRARILAAEALEAARRDADRGDVAGARVRLQAQRKMIRETTVAQSAYMDAMMDDMDEIDDDLTSASKWNAFGSKACAQKSTSHQLQRQCDATENVAFGYDNSFKKCMRSKAKK